MSTRFSPYPKYQDTGLDWLDSVPTHWVLTKLKHEAPFQVGWTPPTKENANFEGSNLWVNISDLRARVIYDTARRISDKAATAASMKISPRGSLLYSFKLSVGAVSFAGKDMYTNEAIASFTEDSRLPLAYLYYALPIFVMENASTNIYGARILNQELIKNSYLLAPRCEEAIQIAKFLDYETAKIDALIEKQQQLIALLEEKRQAVISHAVTKGLNPDAPMRDSGVEWLGEVPAHWTTTALKHHARVIDCKHVTATFVDDGFPLASIGEVKGWKVDLTMAKMTTARYYETLIEGGRRPQPGDIIYTRNATVGEASLVDAEMPSFAMGQDVCLIRPNSEVRPAFLLHSLKSPVVRSQLDLAMVGSTFKRVNVEAIRGFSITLPPAHEQNRIVDELLEKLPRYDSLIGAARSAADLLQERRTALISAAVTGKIDVRGWKAPDSDAEAEVA